jgi:hypothetical protein
VKKLTLLLLASLSGCLDLSSNHPLPAQPATRLERVGGEGLAGAAGHPLPAPLEVRVSTRRRQPVRGVTVRWDVKEGGGELDAATAITDGQGIARVRLTLGDRVGTNVLTAAVDGLEGSPVEFRIRGESTGLVYLDPPPGGKLRLQQKAPSPLDPAERDSVTLELVAAENLKGFSAGYSLPLNGAGRVKVAGRNSGSPFGENAVLAAAVTPRGVLATAVSLRAGPGAGRSLSDVTIPAGAVLCSITLERLPGSAPGVLLDGGQLGGAFTAGLRDLAGNDVVGVHEVAVGRLELR